MAMSDLVKCFWVERVPNKVLCRMKWADGRIKDVLYPDWETAMADDRTKDPDYGSCESCQTQDVFLLDGKEVLTFDLPPGALFDSGWDEMFYGKNEKDGICLCVILPTREKWCIDGRASNCNAPKDSEGRAPKHRCWVRRGDPRTGCVHVPNEHELCTQGAGSIGTSKYHGFLHDGCLRKC